MHAIEKQEVVNFRMHNVLEVRQLWMHVIRTEAVALSPRKGHTPLYFIGQ